MRMPTYKYTEPDTGIVYTITVSESDIDVINQLEIGASVTLSTGHQLIVGQYGHALISDKNGKKSSAKLKDLKSGLIP